MSKHSISFSQWHHLEGEQPLKYSHIRPERQTQYVLLKLGFSHKHSLKKIIEYIFHLTQSQKHLLNTKAILFIVILSLPLHEGCHFHS